MSFDSLIMVDWSARSKPSPVKPNKDAILASYWPCLNPRVPLYFRTRMQAFQAIVEWVQTEISAQRRGLLGFEFAFGYPARFAQSLLGANSVFAVWDWLSGRVTDAADNANNRFQIAAEVNACLPGVGPFWGRPSHLKIDGLPEKGSLREGHGMAERRLVETIVPSAHSVWKLFTIGSVGSQVLMGLPYLVQLRAEFGKAISVWPFETPDTPVVLAEIYPSLPVIGAQDHPGAFVTPDARQVDAPSTYYSDLIDRGEIDNALNRVCLPEVVRREEGWILGVPAP